MFLRKRCYIMFFNVRSMGACQREAFDILAVTLCMRCTIIEDIGLCLAFRSLGFGLAVHWHDCEAVSGKHKPLPSEQVTWRISGISFRHCEILGLRAKRSIERQDGQERQDGTGTEIRYMLIYLCLHAYPAASISWSPQRAWGLCGELCGSIRKCLKKEVVGLTCFVPTDMILSLDGRAFRHRSTLVPLTQNLPKHRQNSPPPHVFY